MRLTGLSLTAARRLAETPAGALILRKKVFADYGIDRLLELPPTSRAPLDIHPGPREQTRRRGWRGADLDAPQPSSARSTAAQLRKAYLDGTTSPVEVLAEIRRRVERQDFGNATFSPFYHLDFDRAEEAAKASADRYSKGQPLGPLDGIPVPIKDQHLMEGLPISGGSACLNEMAAEDAHAIEVLRAAGALLYAKTHTTEWGMNPCGACGHMSLPRNVYSANHGAGGSSTGAGVAVGLGLAPVGTGSDGGGSIRIPAAMNGVFGIKPTYVRIGRSGDIYGSSSVSTVGPLGASTEDLVDLLSISATVDDPNDPTRRWAPAQRDLDKRWRRALGRGVEGAKIGIPSAEWDDLDAPLQQPSLDALKQLEADGAQLVEIDEPLLGHAPAVGVLSIGLETLANVADLFDQAGEHFSDELRMMLALLDTVDAGEFLAAQRTRAALKIATRDLLDDVDLIALPTTQTTAFDYPLALDGIGIADDEAVRTMTRFNFLANITALPAGSVPVGLHGGLPFGLQFIGGAWDEASVLAVMAHAERQGWTALEAPRSCTSLLR